LTAFGALVDFIKTILEDWYRKGRSLWNL
jgi:hypothetical protein